MTLRFGWLSCLFVLICCFPCTGIADPHLRLSVRTTGNHNNWFLCLPGESGCFSLKAGQKQVFPLSGNKILPSVYLLNTNTLALQQTPLPKDCGKDMKSTQILHLTGELREGTLQHLTCHLENAGSAAQV